MHIEKGQILEQTHNVKGDRKVSGFEISGLKRGVVFSQGVIYLQIQQEEV